MTTTTLVAELTHLNHPDGQRGMSQYLVTETKAFFAAVTAAIPGSYLVFKNFQEAYVCHARSPFTLGFVGRADVFGDKKYTVHARGIDNGRFARGSMYRSMVASGELNVAVRNAKKFLTPHSAQEMAAAKAGEVASLMRSACGQHSTTRMAMGRVFNSDALKEELRRLIEADYVFVDAPVHNTLHKYFEAERLEKAAANASRKMVFVHVGHDWRGQVMEVVLMAGADGSAFYSFAVSSNAPAQQYVVADVQPDTVEYLIAGRISVLSMVPVKTYVDGVGVKMEESVYYVEV